MTTHSLFRPVVAAALALSLVIPAFALAQTGGVGAALNGSASAGGGKVRANVGANVTASTTLSAAVMTRAKTKADTEIDRRIKALSDLLTRVNAMTKISAEFKQNLATNVQNQGTALTALKAKIDADTDGPTLKTDIKSITQSYRIFMLVMPQARIAAAADREATIINMMAGIGAKLQARLQTAQQAGANVTALAAALTDMGTQLGAAQTHAQAAITSSATLAPDNGDATVMKTNADALKGARTDIQSAQKDLGVARKDIDTILKGLKGLKVNTTSSTTVQTTP